MRKKKSSSQLYLKSTEELAMSQKAPKAEKYKLIMAVKLFLVEFRFYLFPLLTVFSFITNFSLVASSEGGDGGLEGRGGVSFIL